MGDLSDLHLIIYSYQCGIMDIYFFFFGYLLLTLGYGPVLLYFVAKIVLMLTSFSWLLCHLNAPLILWTFLLVLEHACTFWHYETLHTPLVYFLLQS